MKYTYGRISINCSDLITVKKDEDSIYLYADANKKLKVLFDDDNLLLTLLISGMTPKSMIIRKQDDRFFVDSDLDCELYQFDQFIRVSLNVESYEESTSMEVDLYYKGELNPAQVSLLANNYAHKEPNNEPCF